MHAKTTVYQDKTRIGCPGEIEQGNGYIAEIYNLNVAENTTCRLEKMVSIFTSIDEGIKNPRTAGKRALLRIKSFAETYRAHVRAWANIWKIADIRIEARLRRLAQG